MEGIWRILNGRVISKVAILCCMLPVFALSQCQPNTGQPLDFQPFGNFGLAGQRLWAFTFTPTGGTPPYQFSLASGATPIPGFQVGTYPDVPSFIGPGQGSLFGIAPSGIATETPFATSIEVTDCAGKTVAHPVSFGFTPVEFTVQYLPSQISEGQTFSIPISGVGGTPPYSIHLFSGSLPTGVTFNTAASSLEGTPALGTSGQYNFALEITDARGSNFVAGYTLNIIRLRLLSPRLITTKAGQPFTAPLNIENGTPPYHFKLDLDSSVPPGVSIDPNVGIVGTPTYVSNLIYGVSVDVTDSAPIPNTAVFRFSIFTTGNSPIPLTLLPRYGSDQLFPDATRATFYNDYAQYSGGVPPWSCTLSPGSPPLPPGMIFFDSSAQDTGTAPAGCYLFGSTLGVGTYSFSVRITDSAGNFGDFPATWHVSPLGIWNRFPGYPPQSLILNHASAAPLLVSGGTRPYTITPERPFPVGLSVSPTDPTATLSGTPLEDSDMPFDARIQDAAGNTLLSETFVHLLAPPPSLALFIANGPLPAATTGNLYQANLDVSGPVFLAPFAVSLLADPRGPNPTRSTLPAGLSLETTGFNNFGDPQTVAAIFGTPTEAGDFAYLLKIVDASGNIGQREITLHVAQAGKSTDVSNLVQITTTPFTYDRRTRIYSGVVTIKNISSAAINGPLSTVLASLTPGVTALNASGTVASGPFYTWSNLPLEPGASATFSVQFADPSQTRIGFIPKTYSGQPQ
jgi:large repetitive protein